ncbi:MAG: macro domain-containing protein [Firmicutes bacterium]|jgi:O-acetyl-ADP-ribose deacetylase (regulator of RNase III)|nr:macro domain-containing protein [Bacillota bacterium]
MMRYYEGTVFNAGTEAVVNTVNCVGVMGAGLALEFRLRYPDMFREYQRKAKAGLLRPGFVDYFVDRSGLTIVNFPTKDHFRHPSKLAWIEQGLRHFADTHQQWGFKSVAFPKLGTSHGGLNWKDVQPLMEQFLRNLEVEIVICLDTLPYAEGVEGEMLRYLNAVPVEELTSSVRLSRPQLEALASSRPYSRFWHLSKTPKIGLKTYENIFQHIYARVKDPGSGAAQLTLFSE